MNNKPLVSIIMNCYNGELYLKKALESVLSQTYTNWELIFWDNQSQDKSEKIFKTYKDRRFKFYKSLDHTVLYEARNKAIQKSSGELIAFLDVDDFWLPSKLEKQIELFADTKTGLVYSNFWILNTNSFFKKKIFSRKKLPNGNVLKAMLLNYSVGLSTIIIRKKNIKNINNVFNVKYDLLADYDFIINFSIKNEFQCIQKPTTFIRVHDKGTSYLYKDKQIQQLKSWYNSIQSNKILSSQIEMKKVYERIEYMEVMQIIFEKNFFQSFKRVLKFPFGIKKLKLVLALILPKNIFLQIKRFN